MKKSNLDERQEKELLKIEHNGFWLAYMGLLALILVECVLNFDYRAVLGSLILMLVLCVYMIVACMRAGIWDRHLKPNLKNNLAISGVAGVVVMAFCLVMFSKYGFLVEETLLAVLLGLIAGLFTFALCLGVLSLFSRAFRKRVKKMEAALETEEEE